MTENTWRMENEVETVIIVLQGLRVMEIQMKKQQETDMERPV